WSVICTFLVLTTRRCKRSPRQPTALKSTGVEKSPSHKQPSPERNRLCLLKKSGFTARFLSLLACGLVASLVSPDQVHAVAICGVGLLLRNRTSRFRFCTVAAR